MPTNFRLSAVLVHSFQKLQLYLFL